ncbi:MAG: hypothetical protein WCL18_08925 [bacterium]
MTACVNIENVSTDRRRLTTSVSNGSTSNMRCDLMTPDSNLRSISSCNGEFSYDTQKAGKIKLWIRYVVSYQNELVPSDRENKPNNNNERTYPQWTYDFDNAERLDDN